MNINLDKNVGLCPFDQTAEFTWTRSNGKEILVGDMAKFHLIQACKKLVRLEQTNNTLYEALTFRLYQINHPEEFTD